MKISKIFMFGFLCLFTLVFTSGCEAQQGKNADKKTETTNQTTNNMSEVSYSYGVLMGESLKRQNLDEINYDKLMQGIKDVLTEQKLEVSEEEARTVVQNFMMNKRAAEGKANLEAGKKFLAENAKKEGVITTESGLQYKIIKEGTGEKPGKDDTVEVHYTGKLLDGTVFDSSVERGQPATFPVKGVIQGWIEGLQLMKEGAKFRFFIPSNLAYGARGSGAIPPNSTLIFDVELIDVK